MNAEELRARQAPLKANYKTDPSAALWTLEAVGQLEVEGQTCRVASHTGVVDAGLHPATGGSGTQACSGDMLLQALVACAGVTLGAVATALGVQVRGGEVRARGELDFRGTLGVSRDAPVGFKNIVLEFQLDTDAAPETLARLLELTERYCVIYQTLRHPPVLARTPL